MYFCFAYNNSNNTSMSMLRLSQVWIKHELTVHILDRKYLYLFNNSVMTVFTVYELVYIIKTSTTQINLYFKYHI